MKRNIIYIGCLSVLALFSACTADTDNDAVIAKPTRTPLKITAREGSSQTLWKQFEEGSVITVYNSFQISSTASDQKGKYKRKGNDWVNEPTDDFIGLWPDAIKTVEGENAYFFTATFNSEKEGVTLDQTKKDVFETQDFCVARAIYKEDDTRFESNTSKDYWQNTGIFLHFRHVLSKLKVNLYLPIGDSDKGYFTPANAISNVKMSLKTPYTDYTVDYGTSLRDSEIADVTTDNKNRAPKDLQMYPSEPVDNDKVPGTEIPAKRCTFEAIIPNGQVYQKDKECLTVTLSYKGNKTYTYSPPSNTTMLFQQEKVTVVNLTLLANKPNQIVMINSVSLQDWITDEADMDLIPVPNNN